MNQIGEWIKLWNLSLVRGKRIKRELKVKRKNLYEFGIVKVRVFIVYLKVLL